MRAQYRAHVRAQSRPDLLVQFRCGHSSVFCELKLADIAVGILGLVSDGKKCAMAVTGAEPSWGSYCIGRFKVPSAIIRYAVLQ